VIYIIANNHNYVSWFLRAIAECFARLSHGLDVCLSVCLSARLSVTLLYCIKTGQTKITKSSLWAVTKFRALEWGCYSRTRASKRGTPSERRYFDAIGSSTVKTVAARYTHAVYHNKHWSWAF